eukprot:m.171714 g.171714  ORF g.171714 m.171714 type:complete len:874 (+) comp14559_c0_seq1:346-2967(+)
MSTEERVLLPQDLYPSHYDVELVPDLVKFTFDGKVKISVEVRNATKTVTLHSRELAISTASFSNTTGFTTSVATISFDIKAMTVTMVFEEEMPTGQGFLDIEFVGQLNNQMAGFYRSTYTDINGDKKIMASTQCEAIDARRVLPCWDEPAVKATFGVALVVDSNLEAISNMPEQRVETLKNGKKRVVFLKSPKMSSYLLAFCVGEFDFIQGITEHGVLIRCFSTPGRVDQCHFALDCALKCLDIYDDYFGLPFPLPKMDMIAIPEFAAGAMENWGLVTYREVDLLIDETTASSAQRQRVCTVVTHELAHQWFGNLVTMEWWDNLWLNEGFACFMQTWSADQLFPEWKMWDQFVTSDLAAALRLDALRSSHPIQVPIKHAHEVEEVFDAISYCKGATVIRMIHSVIGDEHFREGLRTYIKRHQYANTVTGDLWSAWSEVSGTDVKALATSWTSQMGYPLLTVDIKESTAEATVLNVQQQWFLADGTGVDDTEKSWTVPVAIGTKSGALAPELKSDRSFEVVVANAGPADWVKLNFGHPVPCRVKYSSQMLQKLGAAIAQGELSVLDRAGLLLDCAALTKANLMDPSDLITLLGSYKGETETVVWDALASSLQMFAGVLAGSDELFTKFKAFAASIVEPAVAVVGWEPKEGEPQLTKLLRTTLISLLGKFSSDDAVMAEARKRFDAVMADPSDANACNADYKGSVFAMVMRTGGKAEYDALMNYFAKLDSDAKRKDVYASIGYAPTRDLKVAALDWTTSGAVKLQDFFYTFSSVGASGSLGTETAWQYYQDNFDRIKAMLAAAGPSLMHAVVAYSTRGFATRERADEIEAFFRKNPVKGLDRALSQLCESIRINAGLRDSVLASKMAQADFWDSI